MEIVKERMAGEGLYSYGVRYYVIKVPIDVTGICFEFKTEQEAENFIRNYKNEDGKHES